MAEDRAGKARIELRTDRDFARLLRVASAVEGREMAEIVREAVEERYRTSPIGPQIHAAAAAAS